MKVGRARNSRDMRPRATKPKPARLNGLETNNRFENLQNSDDEEEQQATKPIMQTPNKAPRWVKVRETPELLSVDFNKPQEIGSVAHVDGQWERIAVKIDSGAIDTVMPPAVGKHFNTIQTEMSQRGPGFRAANGSPIKHYGQRILRGVGDQYQPLNMTAQVADVKTTLGSVNQMLKAGNLVHFETGNCYIENMRTGRKTKIEEKGGTFEVGIWVPMGKGGQPCNKVELADNPPRPVFHRQDEEF